MKKLNISLVLMLFVQTVFGQFNSLLDIQKAILQSEYWNVVDESSMSRSNERLIIPNEYVALKLDLDQLKLTLSNAVLRTENDFSQGVEIDIPTPIGTARKFLAFKNTTMSAGLEAKFSSIRSYDVVAVNDPSIKGKIDVTPQGFHAMIFRIEKGTYFIDPYAKGDLENYIIYNKKDFTTTKKMDCNVDVQSDFLLNKLNSGGDKVLGSCDLRTYRLAVSATGEYTVFQGGTVALAQAAQVTTMNRVNGVFERDAQITMTLIANNNLIVYTDGTTDPFTNGTTGTMINENQTNTDLVIGTANYDIGHVFGTNSGGLAQLQSPCGPNKARGVTGSSAPVNDPFDIDFVAHEIGHQFGGNHTQNNNCNRNLATAVEPGSASSIMGYAGICTPNVQNNSDDHFHGISVEEMSVFISGFGSSCAVNTATVNASPSITGTNGNITIPGGTPFALTAIATDANVANVLSYCWEQTDNDVSTQSPVSTSTGGPNFRSLSPVTSPTRYFPNLTDLMAGGPFTWEVLPTVSRIMNFRVTVRDNAGPLPEVSCSDIQDVTVTIDATSGPFVETFPSAAGITWTGSTIETVTWNEAGTATGAVSCANVDILLSTDGGLTYPTTLASNVSNTGAASVTVPNITTSSAVVMITCSDRTFFDISDNVFAINAAVIAPPASVACLDTVFYPESKRTDFSQFQLLSETGNFLSGVSQTYNSSTGTIHGINAYVLLDTNGIVGDAPSKDIYIKVFNVDALNRPIGAAIDSNLVTLNDVGTARQALMFASPVAVSGRYAISVTLNPLTSVANNDSIWFRGNDDQAVTPDGLGEGLLSLNLNFPGFGWTNFLLQFAAADYDALLAPIFGKTISSDYTTDVDTICLGEDVVFSNTAILDTNYMYNRWDSLNTDPWIWNYGDGTGTYNHFDTTYTFASAGTFTTQLLITNYGYSNNCVDSIQKDIEVIGSNVQVNSDTIVCTGTALTLSATGSATTYTWDNGLGVGQNQTITPTFDTLYTVTGESSLGSVTCSSSDSVFVALAPCNCVDTVFYPESKRTNFGAFQLLSETGNFLNGVSQAYNSNTGLIHGIDAFVLLDTNGIVGDAPSKDVYIKVFNVDALNQPIGAAIDSNLVTLNDVGTVRQTLLFASPVAVSGSYAISVALNPLTSVANNDSIWFRGNDELATPPDGLGEGLLSLNLNFPGFGWTNFFLQFGSADYDALLAPIFDKTISSSYTTDVDTVCLGGDVVFSNTAILDTNYMYNRWDSLNTDPWVWNYGDGTGTYNHFDTTYTFASAGTFTTQLLITNYGYSNNCVDSIQKDIEVLETIVTASTDTVICLGDTVFLSATGANTYIWDNGLGAGQNQSIAPITDTMFVVSGTGFFNCIGTDTVNVTINGLPTVIASNDTILCLGDTATISATSTETVFTWDNGLGVGQNHMVSPSSNTMYVVSVTDINNCVGMDTVEVSSQTLPIVTASNDIVICIGDTATISATSTETVFTWDNGLGLGQIHMVSPNSDTMYVVSVTDINNCVGTDTVQVSTQALPIIIASNDTAICIGDTAFLSATGGDTYNWDNGLGAGQNQSAFTLLDAIYVVTGANAVGCENTDTIQVAVNALPTVITSNDTILCLGDTATISATSTETVFTWDNGLGLGQSHMVSPSSNTMYVVSVTDINNCVGMDTVQVSSQTLPIVIASNDTVICIGDAATISATSTETVFTWDNGLGLGQSHMVSPSSDTMYVVSVTDINNCVGTDTVQVSTQAFPVIIASNDIAICIGDTAFLSATGGDTYNWDNGLGAGQNQSAFTLLDTIYVVTGSNSIGCESTDTIQVTVNALPIVTASNDTIVCAADTIFLGATGANTYIWDNGLGAGQNQTAFASIDTMYVVVGTDLSGCSGLDTVQVTVLSSPIVTASTDTTICIGDTVTISATSMDTMFIWDNGLGQGSSHIVSPDLDASYIVSITDTNNCIGRDTVLVTVDGFNIVASNDTAICLGGNAVISAAGGSVYTWDNGLGAGERFEVSPTGITTYIVTSDENGCVTSDTVVISIETNCFKIPNVFTPNGDGINDVWNIKGLDDYPNVKVKVFNRLGDSVFESDTGYTSPWDGTYNGTDSPSATYYYIIVLGDDEDGISGTINIVR